MNPDRLYYIQSNEDGKWYHGQVTDTNTQMVFFTKIIGITSRLEKEDDEHMGDYFRIWMYITGLRNLQYMYAPPRARLFYDYMTKLDKELKALIGNMKDGDDKTNLSIYYREFTNFMAEFLKRYDVS